MAVLALYSVTSGRQGPSGAGQFVSLGCPIKKEYPQLYFMAEGFIKILGWLSFELNMSITV